MPDLPPPPAPPLSLAGALADWARSVRPAWATRRALTIGAVCVGVFVVVAAWGRSALAGPPPEAFLPRATAAGDGGAGSGGDGDADGTAPRDADGGPITVHAAGAFAKPGVYELPAGSRVAQLLDAAGGGAGGALVDALNLAAHLADGERVYLPRAGEVAPPQLSGSAGSPGDGRSRVIDLNRATADELDDLPGVGPATATAIVEHRTQVGRFRSVDELLEVRGIGEAKLATLRKHVRV
ncbi:MAG TPA: helix-hairpin-helix domain-containing protein [Acidimicrobiales bacterium]